MKLYNTLTRKTEDVTPLHGKDIKVYTCGLTVYSQPHIGNWVPYIYWDVLVRTLRANGYNVTRVENYTDVGHLVSDDDAGEDKMEKGARAEGLTAWDVADKYIKIAQHEAYDLLGLTRPEKLIRATSCIDKQILFVKELETKGFTYVIEGEGVYFDTSKLNDYGKLARLDIEGLQAGARVDIGGKKHPTDFALWKFSPANQKRDMEWDSPWGKGFPGWHLECSVIARENLGDQIDIHTGGVDHIPVHHTNEIAQTEALTGKQFSQIWLHNNHLKVDGGKMSKSLGNIYTLQDILDKGYSLEAFKLMILSKHYRTEGNFTWEILEAAQNRFQNWQAVIDTQHQLEPSKESATQDIEAAMRNDLNSPQALAAIDTYFDAVMAAGQAPSQTIITDIDRLLGIRFIHTDITQDQKNLLEKRAAARSDKDWAESDRIRDELTGQGISLSDGPLGQIWHRL